MKMYRLFNCVLLLMIPLCATAGWEVSQPQSAMPREPFFQAAPLRKPIHAPIAYRAPITYRAPIFSNQLRKPLPAPVAYNAPVFPNQFTHLAQGAPLYAISISGSLKENLERILGRYHWRVVWKSPYDYNFDGRVTGSSLPNVVEKILQPFPLQAVMYMSNRTVAVIPRYRT